MGRKQNAVRQFTGESFNFPKSETATGFKKKKKSGEDPTSPSDRMPFVLPSYQSVWGRQQGCEHEKPKKECRRSRVPKSDATERMLAGGRPLRRATPNSSKSVQ